MSISSVIEDKLPFSIILDGEMLVWDPISGRNLPFGTLKSAALGTFQSMERDNNGSLPTDKSKKDLNPRPCCAPV
jgi:DNA ligase 4